MIGCWSYPFHGRYSGVSLAQRKAEWDTDKKQGMERYVRELNWTEHFKNIDPDLWEKAFGGSGYVLIQ